MSVRRSSNLLRSVWVKQIGRITLNLFSVLAAMLLFFGEFVTSIFPVMESAVRVKLASQTPFVLLQYYCTLNIKEYLNKNHYLIYLRYLKMVYSVRVVNQGGMMRWRDDHMRLSEFLSLTLKSRQLLALWSLDNVQVNKVRNQYAIHKAQKDHRTKVSSC